MYWYLFYVSVCTYSIYESMIHCPSPVYLCICVPTYLLSIFHTYIYIYLCVMHTISVMSYVHVSSCTHGVYSYEWMDVCVCMRYHLRVYGESSSFVSPEAFPSQSWGLLQDHSLRRSFLLCQGSFSFEFAQKGTLIPHSIPSVRCAEYWTSPPISYWSLCPASAGRYRLLNKDSPPYRHARWWAGCTRSSPGSIPTLGRARFAGQYTPTQCFILGEGERKLIAVLFTELFWMDSPRWRILRTTIFNRFYAGPYIWGRHS